jgi:hypothetical protein
MMDFFLREMIESLLHEDNPPLKRGFFIATKRKPPVPIKGSITTTALKALILNQLVILPISKEQEPVAGELEPQKGL